MKAWIVESINDFDYNWNEIVFARNYKEAKQLAICTNLYQRVSDCASIKIERYKYLDNMENFSEKELDFEKWKLGWYWEDIQNPYYEEQLSEEENRKIFEEWYSEYYKGDER